MSADVGYPDKPYCTHTWVSATPLSHCGAVAYECRFCGESWLGGWDPGSLESQWEADQEDRMRAAIETARLRERDN